MPGDKKHHTEKFRSCVEGLMADGKDKDSAYAICTSAFQKKDMPIYEERAAENWGETVQRWLEGDDADAGMMRYLHLRGVTGEVRRAELHGRPHLVVPVTALVEGVIHAVNADSAEYVPVATLRRGAASYNGRPAVLGHPVKGGRQCSANSPDVMNSKAFGTIFNSRVEGNRLLQEAWLDEEKTKALHPRMYERLLANEQIEVSVGALVATDTVAGKFNGKPYAATWREMTGDHLAFLPDGRGACSVAMGCGTNRAAEEHPVLYALEDGELKALDWNEDDHPRDETGRFAPSGGSGNGETKAKDVDFEAKAKEILGSRAEARNGYATWEMESRGGRKDLRAEDKFEEVRTKLKEFGYEKTDDVRERGYVEESWTHADGSRAHLSVTSRAGDRDNEDENYFSIEMFSKLRELEGFKDSAEGDKKWRDRYAAKKDCPACDGTGSKDGNPCESCDGKGQVDKPRYAELLRTLMPRGWGDDEIKQELRDALHAIEPQARAGDVLRVTDSKIVYCIYPPPQAMPYSIYDAVPQMKYYERSYTFADGKFTLGAERVEVEPTTVYERKAAEKHDCGCGGHDEEDCKCKDAERAAEENPSGSAPLDAEQLDRLLQEKAAAGDAAFKAATGLPTGVPMTPEQKAALIKQLVADQYSGFTAGDEKFLEGASDERLESFRVAAEARKTREVELKAAADKTTLTREQFLEVAPPELKTLIKRQERQETEAKTALIVALKAAQSVYSEAELSVMSVEELQRMAQLAKVEPKTYDMSGRGVPRAAAAGEEDDFTPPNPYEKGLKALQGASAR